MPCFRQGHTPKGNRTGLSVDNLLELTSKLQVVMLKVPFQQKQKLQLHQISNLVGFSISDSILGPLFPFSQSFAMAHSFGCFPMVHCYESRRVCQLQNLFFTLQVLPDASEKRALLISAPHFRSLGMLFTFISRTHS